MPKNPTTHRTSDPYHPARGQYILENMGLNAYLWWSHHRNAVQLERVQKSTARWKEIEQKEKEDIERVELEAAKSMARLNALIAQRKLDDSKKKLVFVTLSFDETLVTPTGTVPIVESLIANSNIHKAACFWEWRDPEAATGLHCHLVLIGETRRITEFLKRRNGPSIKSSPKRPYTKLCKEFKTLKLYPQRFFNDKVNYCLGETFKSDKNHKKSFYPELRKKHNLPNIFK